jgi:protein tyrosine phosphatase
MEDHLRNRHRLEAEWQALCTDEANEERSSSSVALSEVNANKNRYTDCIPCKFNELTCHLSIRMKINVYSYTPVDIYFHLSSVFC